MASVMSLQDAVNEMNELRVESSVLFEVYEVGALAAGIHSLIMMRNKTNGLDSSVVAARRALLDPAIKLLKAQLRKDIRTQLIPALQKWEELE